MTGDEAIERTRTFKIFSSGSAAIDRLLGGGYREGHLVELLGSSNSGKTQLAMQAALCVSRAGKLALFVDSEGSFRPERIEEMAVDRGWDPSGILKRIVCVRTDSYAEQIEIVEGMNMRAHTATASLVVVDTLTRNFTVGFPGRSNLAERQGALGRYLSVASRDAYINNRAYLLTNRVTFGPTHDIAIGGKTVEQMVHESLLLERDGSSLKATRLPDGGSAMARVGKAGVE